MSLSESAVRTALAGVVDPNTGKDLVAGKAVRAVRVDGDAVAVDIELGYPARSQIEPMRRRVCSTAPSARTVPRP